MPIASPVCEAAVRWRCRRGCRELDLLLQAYLAADFRGAPEAERQRFLALLELPDDQLQRLLLGQSAGADAGVDQLVAKIRSRAPL